MSTTTESTETAAASQQRTVQVFRVYIKASAERVWQALTDPAWNDKYGYRAPSEFELRAGGTFRSTPNQGMRDYAAQQGFPMPDVILDGEVIKCEPPTRLVQTWRMLMDPTTAAEGFSRLTYEIRERDGVSRLTVTHDVTGKPALAALTSGADEDAGAGGGWDWVLSDLKSWLETGVAFPVRPPDAA